MRCLVTGMETKNKWRNFPLCKEMIQMANAMKFEPGFENKTTRERILKLHERWSERIEEEASKTKGKE